MSVRIALYQTHFGEAEKPVCEADEITVSGCRYDSGVSALRISNERGDVIMLPFQGSQIWRSDKDGFAHALQKHPEGFSDYIGYRSDQDGVGLAFSAAAGVEGYAAEKAKGRGIDLAGGETWRLDMTMGHLTANETDAMISEINDIRAT